MADIGFVARLKTMLIRWLVQLAAVLALVSLAACSGPDRDGDLEASVSRLVDAEEVFAISTFGNVVVTVSSNSAFEMSDADRESLAEKVAGLTFEHYADASAIVIGFATRRPKEQHVAYAWRVVDGGLQRVEDIGGQVVEPSRS